MKSKDLTMDAVRDSLKLIETAKDDPEKAHSLEKETWEGVLQAIEAGSPIAAGLASLALSSSKIQFSRWTA